MKLLICLTLLLSSWGYAADVVEIQGAEAQLIDIDLSSFCKDVCTLCVDVWVRLAH